MYITNPAHYPGIPKYTKGFQLTTYITMFGLGHGMDIEAGRQTQFWIYRNRLTGWY